MLTLSPSTKPHVLRGDYDVPVGKTLCLEAGVNLQCGPDSEINVNGTLIMEGTKEKPIVLNGLKSAPGFWKGITLREAEKCSLSWVELYDAGVGIFVSKCKLVITSCIFAGNNTGIKVDSRNYPPAMEDCVVSYNSADGISLNGISSITIRSCTISYNGGWGINGIYYPSPIIATSIITRNKLGGIFLTQYESKAEAHDCAIGGNAGPDVRNECKNDLDFTKNYWGPDVTKALKSSGSNVNLPSIFDGQDKRECGRVQLEAFLDKMPEKCGSSITSVKGRPVK
jgi:parallel beta-helix repeat protein